MVGRLFFAVPRGCLRFVIVVFPDHTHLLLLYGNIVRKECVEKDLARRQLAVRDSTSKSWFITLREILYKYGLPTAQELLDNPPGKLAWKIMVR